MIALACSAAFAVGLLLGAGFTWCALVIEPLSDCPYCVDNTHGQTRT